MPKGQKEDIRMVNGWVVNFKYPEVVANSYRYRGVVENHNSLRHGGSTKSQIVFNSAWVTTWCPIRLFTFFVTTQLMDKYMGKYQ